ncbi:MAG: fumarylacetoacetate hydrolase family protein [Pseudomonadota bacterium]|nr:fumarylacetoacetate hydrolase family protein [Pseudomonadota bacterium]
MAEHSPYQHRSAAGESLDLPPGKVVCVGRNYAAHARELGNPIPDAPVLFMKPSTALVAFEAPWGLPAGLGPCEAEAELALLIRAPLSRRSTGAVLDAVAAAGVALDLTLRAVQSELKAKGHPWERAKAFDGACPVTPWVSLDQLPPMAELVFESHINGTLRQHGQVADMLFDPASLLTEINQLFTLLPGDVVLTGTPAGVGPLVPGDEIELKMDGRCWKTVVGG